MNIGIHVDTSHRLYYKAWQALFCPRIVTQVYSKFVFSSLFKTLFKFLYTYLLVLVLIYSSSF